MTLISRSRSVVRILTEAEIQQKLYGAGRRSAKSVSPNSEWTGSEILSREVERLRSELVSLRYERECLAGRLDELRRAPSGGHTISHPWIRSASVWLVLLGAMGTLLGVRLLQASPSLVHEVSPYTVQVAVYDVRTFADEAAAVLKGLQYEAFLVEETRRNGRHRWRVYVGSFVTRGEANAEQMRLNGDPRFKSFKDAFVRFR